MSEIYQNELKQILLVWVFSFACSNCMMNDVVSTFKYITAKEPGNKDTGLYASPPTIWCGCNEMLYPIKSFGLYDLFESLYDKDENGYIILGDRPIETNLNEGIGMFDE